MFTQGYDYLKLFKTCLLYELFRMKNGQWKFFHGYAENTGKKEKSYVKGAGIDLSVSVYCPKPRVRERMSCEESVIFLINFGCMY